MNPLNVNWTNVQETISVKFSCGHCGHLVASQKGWDSRGKSTNSPTPALIRVCPQCDRPTFLTGNVQVPSISYGSDVKHLPEEIEKLYKEARDSLTAPAPTASVLCCRKLLMHVAVDCGANKGENFVAYVDYLEQKNFIPARAKAWVDEIRKKGNETNHEINIRSRADAEEMIDFVEMLLKVIYEYPSRVVSKTPGPSST